MIHLLATNLAQIICKDCPSYDKSQNVVRRFSARGAILLYGGFHAIQEALTVVKKKRKRRRREKKRLAGTQHVRCRTNDPACESPWVLSHATFFGVARVSSRSTKSSFARMRVPMPSESRWRTEETPREWAFIVAVAYGGSPSLNTFHVLRSLFSLISPAIRKRVPGPSFRDLVPVETEPSPISRELYFRSSIL